MKEEETARLLKALLDSEGVEWSEEGGFIRFRLKRDGMLWEIACRGCGEAMVFYGRFPFRVPDTDRARRLCEKINRELLRGALFLAEDGCPVYRCTAELFDAYGAEDALISALRYSAQVTAHYWGRLSGLT